MNRILIDGETGEPITELETGDRILRASSLEAYQKKEEALMKIHENDITLSEPFTKVYLSAIQDFIKHPLSAAEQRIAWLCMSRTPYITNVVKTANKKPISKEQIARELGYSIRNVERALKSLCDRGFLSIYEVGDRQGYILNPYIAMKGKWMDGTLQAIFDEDTYNKVYPEDADGKED